MAKHIYSENLKLGAYYTYDKNNKKVYDIKTMREDFKDLVKKLKKQTSTCEQVFSRYQSAMSSIAGANLFSVVNNSVNKTQNSHLTHIAFFIYICGVNNQKIQKNENR